MTPQRRRARVRAGRRRPRWPEAREEGDGRRGAAAGGDGSAALTPQSFGLFDWVEDAIDAIEDAVEDVGEVVVNVVNSVVDSVNIAINTAMDGLKVAFDAVVRTVEDMASAVWSVLKVIADTVMKVVNFLCGLYDFSAYLGAANFIHDQLFKAIEGSQRTSKAMLTSASQSVGSLESTLLSALGGPGMKQLHGKTRTELSIPFDLDFGGPLGWLLGLVMDALNPLFELLDSAFNPLKQALGGLSSKVSTLEQRFADNLLNSDVLKLLSDPSSLADSDPVEFLKSLGRDVVRIISDLAKDGLASGKVLIAGGTSETGPLSTVDIFDPTLGTFAPAPAMHEARSEHLAVLLADGRVLVAGGIGVDGALQTAEVYNPSTSTWLTLRSLATPRSDPTGTLLADGGVLAVGGVGAGDVPLASTELYYLSSNGGLCEEPADCQSGVCVDGVCCNTACDAGPCDVCAVRTDLTPLGGAAAGTCKLLTGPACDDGDGCTQIDACVTGACVGASPVQCPVPDQCQNPGVCSPASGQCSAPTPKNDGAFCNDNNPCTTNSCQAGQCTVTAQKICPAPDQCHESVTCDLITGQCPALPAKADGSLCNDNNPCTKVDVCQAGVCTGTNPIECPAPDACHEAVACDAATGECPALPPRVDGYPCSDGDPCTTLDVCQAGACAGTNPIQCPKPDACHDPVVCDVATGQCPALPAKPDGSLCNDSDACTKIDLCQAGACVGTSPILCPTPDACHEPVSCDAKTGECPALPQRVDGYPCDDDDACTKLDVCQAGACTGTNPVQCPKPDDCHEPVECDTNTGECPALPARVDGYPCDDSSACTANDVCQSGACVGTESTKCPAPDGCHEPVTCDALTGACPELPKKDPGTYCPDDNDCTINEVCDQSGACQVTETACDCAGCAPYRCFGTARVCLTKCSSVAECATGYVCDPKGACVPEVPVQSAIDEGGCAVGLVGSDDAGRAGALLSLSSIGLLRLAARRRRAARLSGRRPATARAPQRR